MTYSVPTAAYQLCGTAYSGAALEYNAAPPAAAQGVAGVVISGKITTNPTPFTTTTDAAGRYCITAPPTMVDDVLGGATVTITAALPSPSPSTFTTITNNPWKSASGIFGTSNIGTLTFLAHKYSGLDSAYNFNFLVS